MIVNPSKKISTLFCVTLMVFSVGCFRHWTEKEKEAFAVKCSQRDTVENLTFYLTGFQHRQIEQILIRQVKNNKVIDSFYVYPGTNSFDSARNQYGAYIDRKICIKDTYQFILAGEKPYVLSGMKMIVWPQWTMLSEGYGCLMGEYKIDTTQFTYDQTPNFVKREFKSK